MKNMLTIEAFAEWAEKQPADGTYDYMNSCGCAFQQYALVVGLENPMVGSTFWYVGGVKRPLPEWIDIAVSGQPHTFGALASRLRASLQEDRQP